MPGITGAVATASNTRMELFLCLIKKMNSKISEELRRLEHELEQNKIKSEHASENKLPITVPIGETNGMLKKYKCINELPIYEEYLKDRIKFLKGEIELLKMEFIEGNANITNTILKKPSTIESNSQEKKDVTGKDERTDTTAISHELSNAQGIILRQRNRIKSLEKGITKRELEKLIDDNNCRKKNGMINYSAIGRILGCTHHTAKSKCVFFNIS